MRSETSGTAPILRRARTAQLISNLTAPPLLAVPVYVILALYDQGQRGFSSLDLLWLIVISVTFGVSLPTGFVLFLRSRNTITDIHISVRQQRTVPYIVTILLYLIGFGLDYWLVGGGVMCALMFCYATNALITLFINFYWKISAHAIGVGGPLAILTLLFGWTIVPFYLLIPLVDWARVYLKAHTLGQVVVGSLFGLCFTAAQLLLIFRPLGWV